MSFESLVFRNGTFGSGLDHVSCSYRWIGQCIISGLWNLKWSLVRGGRAWRSMIQNMVWKVITFFPAPPMGLLFLSFLTPQLSIFSRPGPLTTAILLWSLEAADCGLKSMKLSQNNPLLLYISFVRNFLQVTEKLAILI